MMLNHHLGKDPGENQGKNQGDARIRRATKDPGQQEQGQIGRVIPMPLGFIALLLLCQLIGEVLVLLLALPVPGPVLGMLLLFVGLVLRGGVPAGLGQVADGLLAHLSLLFVPAGVGVMLHLAMLRAEWLAVTLALVLSTVLTLVTTGLLMSALIRWREGPREEGS
ncbi:Antiholin-like protein LrgA [Thiorhodovibrio winogradskyi]|uniref:Antiholin-like protein LrgA n=1 Tax=Thiorhodovibrio winogradskyi TaxID=77007 RepID=A0ABZ0SEJ4_9GAMM|nr:CidA/LrgA family protein [Thiorhodovibrio winogradskyi]